MSTVDDERTSASSSSRGRTGTRGKKFVTIAVPVHDPSFTGSLSFVGLTTGTPLRTFRRGNVMGRARRKLTTLASGGDETSTRWTSRAAASSKYIINNAIDARRQRVTALRRGLRRGRRRAIEKLEMERVDVREDGHDGAGDTPDG